MAMLDYAGTETRRVWSWRGVVIMLLAALLVVSGTLCVRAMRWDRWARYESSHIPLLDFGGESYSSFKAWRARRACWERSLAAAVISAVAIAGSLVAGVLNWRRWDWLKWLVVLVPLHLVVVMYFVWRWGPDFRHPAAAWGG